MGYTVDGRKIIQQKYHYIQYITISINHYIQASNTSIILSIHDGEMDNHT